jgi:hypothetical protein
MSVFLCDVPCMSSLRARNTYPYDIILQVGYAVLKRTFIFQNYIGLCNKRAKELRYYGIPDDIYL